MTEAMLSKSLIQFSAGGWSCVPSMLFDLRPNYGGGNEDNGDHCAPGEEWRNNYRNDDKMEGKRKQCPVVDVTGDGSKSHAVKNNIA